MKKSSTNKKSPARHNTPIYMPPMPRRQRAKSRHRLAKAAGWFGITFGLMGVVYFSYAVLMGGNTPQSRNILTRLVSPQSPQPKFGKILLTEPAISYDTNATKALIFQANKGYVLPVQTGISKQVIRYTSSDEEGREVPVYARVYTPTSPTPNKNLPVFAFAPGTTGIDDRCAASLEKPAVANWANYDSLMAAYAAQGYAVVITDYQGMRDPDRMHHYMIGAQEGRAVLDSVRALKNLPTTKDTIDSKNIFVSGYSQGGHAALWADMIADNYAPEIDLKGLVGFGPVSDVQTTLADITRGANINWFGPFILTSYQDFYRTNYNLSSFLLPKWQQSIKTDIATQCINTVIPHWGKNPAAIYQPEFLAALTRGDLSGNYSDLARDLAKNRAGTVATPTAKLINHGQKDNVVLPSQSEALRQRLCLIGGGSLSVKLYPTATHYDTMAQSFNDTMNWMSAVRSNQPLPSSCQ